MNFYEPKSSIPEERRYRIRILGADNANPTLQIGQSVTVTRTGEGAYRIAFNENPGTFIGWSCNLGAATPADLKGYTVVRGTYDATNKRLDFVVYNSTFVASDLIANQYADIIVEFAATSEVA